MENFKEENKSNNNDQLKTYDSIFFNFNDENMKIATNIRNIVFVEEQNVPLDRENDNLDQECTHGLFFVIKDSNKIHIGTVRLKYDSDNVVHIQRFCILKEYRKEGYGSKFFNDIMEYLKLKKELKTIMLSSQAYIVNFYKKFGFIVSSESYMDAGIEHFDMILEL